MFDNALRLARFNWPLYAFAAATCLVGAWVGAMPAAPLLLRAGALAAATGAAWFGAASFLAFHWMFDRSELTRWEWVREELDGAPQRWVEINAGLDETTTALHAVFPSSEGKVLGVYDPGSMTAPALNRARELSRAGGDTASPDALPVASGWADAIVVVLAAHEIRDAAQRTRFFAEVSRILSAGGTVLLVEHLRDAASALAFGPGFLHFYPRSEWLRLLKESGLSIVRERAITSFVRVFTCRRTV